MLAQVWPVRHVTSRAVLKDFEVMAVDSEVTADDAVAICVSTGGAG
jgi:hypothetical protein